MSSAEILIALLIASKSGRRNRALKGWIPNVHWAQKRDEKGQMLCHSKADVSQQDVLAPGGGNGAWSQWGLDQIPGWQHKFCNIDYFSQY